MDGATIAVLVMTGMAALAVVLLHVKAGKGGSPAGDDAPRAALPAAMKPQAPATTPPVARPRQRAPQAKQAHKSQPAR
jgi:hypothetical protein